MPKFLAPVPWARWGRVCSRPKRAPRRRKACRSSARRTRAAKCFLRPKKFCAWWKKRAIRLRTSPSSRAPLPHIRTPYAAHSRPTAFRWTRRFRIRWNGFLWGRFACGCFRWRPTALTAKRCWRCWRRRILTIPANMRGGRWPDSRWSAGIFPNGAICCRKPKITTRICWPGWKTPKHGWTRWTMWLHGRKAPRKRWNFCGRTRTKQPSPAKTPKFSAPCAIK